MGIAKKREEKQRTCTKLSAPSVKGNSGSLGLAGGDTKVGGAALIDIGLKQGQAQITATINETCAPENCTAT